MAVIVVTEGDVAGIPYQGDRYSFSLDEKNRGPFAALLPLSQLLDPSREAESIESLQHQFEAMIPDALSREFLSRNPSAYESSIRHYHQMKEAALKAGALPTYPITPKHQSDVKKALDSCEPWISNFIDTQNLFVGLVAKDTLIDMITPDTKSVPDFKTLGCSTGLGTVYAKSDMLRDPTSLLREEILHEAEAMIKRITKARGNPEYQAFKFTHQSGYKAAIRTDIKNGANNPLYRHLVSQYAYFMKEHYGGKSNLTLSKNRKNLPEKLRDREHFSLYTETLPEIYDIATMVREKLAANGGIDAGGFLGIGAKRHTTLDEVMNTAFPNTWPLLQGPPPGKKYIQYGFGENVGKVVEVDRKLNVPRGMAHIPSLRECFESAINTLATLREKEVSASSSKTPASPPPSPHGKSSPGGGRLL